MADTGGIGYGITCGTIVAQAAPGTPGTTVATTATSAPNTATVGAVVTTVVAIATTVAAQPTDTAALPGFPDTGNGAQPTAAQPATSALPLLLLAVALAMVVGAGGLLIARGRTARR